MSVPIRTCAGCGRKAPKSELLRFTVVDDELALVPESAGRGAYTCRRRSCYERAMSSRSFSRVLHAAVRVDPALRDLLYTD
jgi:predicted RNA-binding protein YlxR (DUF448 family)